MLRKTRDIAGYRVYATDGDIGRLLQFYFDDETWTIRYLAVQTGGWNKQRQVLISPIAVTAIDDQYKKILLNVKHGKVGESPAFSASKPLTRLYERRYYEYYGWPVYWGAGNRWGTERTPNHLFTAAPFNEAEAPREVIFSATNEIAGFTVFAQNEKLGYVESFIFDDQTWSIRFIVTDASADNMGSVLLSPRWISDVSMYERILEVDRSIDFIRGAPPCDPGKEITREYEEDLSRYYGTLAQIDEPYLRLKVTG